MTMQMIKEKNKENEELKQRLMEAEDTFDLMHRREKEIDEMIREALNEQARLKRHECKKKQKRRG